MRLTPTELDRLTIFTAAELARRRRAKGWRLTYPEALALICDEMHEAARGGASYEEVVAVGPERPDRGRRAGGRRRPGRDGQARVPVRRRDSGPSRGAADRPGPEGDGVRPGEILFAEGPIPLNAGRPTAEVTVTNASDHTIFISSHYPVLRGQPPPRVRPGRAPGACTSTSRPAIRCAGARARRGRVRLVAYGGQPDGARLQPADRRSRHARAAGRRPGARARAAGYGHRDAGRGRRPRGR